MEKGCYDRFYHNNLSGKMLLVIQMCKSLIISRFSKVLPFSLFFCLFLKILESFIFHCFQVDWESNIHGGLSRKWGYGFKFLFEFT